MPFAFDWLSVLLLLLPLPLAVIANVAVREKGAEVANYILCALVGCVVAGFGYVVLLETSLPLRAHAASPLSSPVASLLLLAGGFSISLVVLPPVRDRLARLLPLDALSPVHLAALTLTLAVAAFQLWVQFGTDALGQTAAAPPVTPADLVGQEIPLALAALAGVGIFVRRTPSAAVERIGWRVPRWWHIALALLAAGIFFWVANAFDYLGHLLTPGLAHKVDVTNQHLMGGLGSPAGIATVALSAGICEEALFRGALQPRLGIAWVSVVFALVHTQYGLSFDTLAVLTLGVGLGFLRRYLNTTSSTITHVAYNTLAGTGLPGPTFVAAIVIQVGLAVVLLGAFLLRARASRNSLTARASTAPGRQ